MHACHLSNTINLIILTFSHRNYWFLSPLPHLLCSMLRIQLCSKTSYLLTIHMLNHKAITHCLHLPLWTKNASRWIPPTQMMENQHLQNQRIPNAVIQLYILHMLHPSFHFPFRSTRDTVQNPLLRRHTRFLSQQLCIQRVLSMLMSWLACQNSVWENQLVMQAPHLFHWNYSKGRLDGLLSMQIQLLAVKTWVLVAVQSLLFNGSHTSELQIVGYNYRVLSIYNKIMCSLVWIY